MRLFITGAAGFIGSHVVLQSLLDHQVVACCRRSANPKVVWPVAPTIVRSATLSDVEPINLVGTDVLIHLAAHTPNHPYDDLEPCIKHNVTEPLRLFRKAVLVGVKKFVVAGTYFEYGAAARQFDRVPVTAGVNPQNTYATSKAMATLAFQQFARDTNTEMTILRLAQVYGPGEEETRLWPSLMKAAAEGADFDLTEGDQVRDFVDVGHVTSAILHAAQERLQLPGAVIRNVGSGEPQTLRAFAEYWWHKAGATGKLNFGAKPYSPDEIMRYVPAC